MTPGRWVQFKVIQHRDHKDYFAKESPWHAVIYFFSFFFFSNVVYSVLHTVLT